MSRSKTISDDHLLDRLSTALQEFGPSDLSFAKASAAAGLSAATLVQRFGSRNGMIEAILLRAWDKLDQATAAADAKASPDWRGSIDLLMHLTVADTADYDVTDGLLLLREDIRNPVLRARGAAWGERLAAALGRRLSENKDRGEQLGWQMVSLWQGTLIWWAFRRDTDLDAKVRQTLEGWYGSIAERK